MDKQYKDAIVSGGLDLLQNGVGSMVNAGINLALSKRNSDMQLQNQRQLNQEAYDRQLEFWHMQNSYNSPAAQIARLRLAGLNPALMNGQSMSNQAGSLSSVQGGNAQTPTQGVNFDSMDSFLVRIAQLKQMGLVDEQTDLFVQQVIGQELSNDLSRIAKARGWTAQQVEELERIAKEKSLFGDDYSPSDNPFSDYSYEDNLEWAYNEYNLRRELTESQIAYNDALTEYSKAQTDTEKEQAANLVVERGLTLLKYDTEKSLAKLNNFKSKKLQQDYMYDQVLKPLEQNAMIIANRAGRADAKLKEVQAALENFKFKLRSNDDGDPNVYGYFSDLLDTIGGILGVVISPSAKAGKAANVSSKSAEFVSNATF